ncbi:MAG: hypothetical protein KAJ43_10245, partial [Gemmatimonadetes bacterium]|nr:hypothetical protein [Gemmatimonadota bacterium]
MLRLRNLCGAARSWNELERSRRTELTVTGASVPVLLASRTEATPSNRTRSSGLLAGWARGSRPCSRLPSQIDTGP